MTTIQFWFTALILVLFVFLLGAIACVEKEESPPNAEPQKSAPRFDTYWDTYDPWLEERPYCYEVQGYDGNTSYYDEYGNYEGECIGEEELKRIENESRYWSELNERPSPYER